MKIIEITENESISLDEELIKELFQIKSQDPELPFRIDHNKIIFNDYTIGEIQLKDILIRIKPRHAVLGLNHYFEMLLYIDKIDSNALKTISYANNTVFGINGLINNFINVCLNLISFGLTGVFTSKKIKSFKPKGKIIFSDYKKQIVPIEGIPVQIEDHKLDNVANQIIKKALLKINEYANLSTENRYNLLKILDRFTIITDYKKKNDDLKTDIVSFYSANHYYSIALEYAYKIIMDFKLGYSTDIGVQWNAFLVNSNDIFEKYIRKILERELPNKVDKWKTPKKFAEINLSGKIGEKSFSPDIIIDLVDGRAKAVFDVKNKHFSPNEETLSSLTSVADIYELLFYAMQLKPKVCGLIYPADNFYEPIKVDINGFDSRVFLLSINMSEDFEKRKKVFLDHVQYCLQYT